MNATTANPVSTATTATTIPAAGSGSGAASGAEAALPLPGLTRVEREAGAVTVPLDAFAKRAGPDVSVATDAGLVRVHAVFQMDPSTREMSVSVVDEAGRLVRMIPPDSVAKMIAAMAAYRGR